MTDFDTAGNDPLDFDAMSSPGTSNRWQIRPPYGMRKSNVHIRLQDACSAVVESRLFDDVDSYSTLWRSALKDKLAKWQELNNTPNKDVNFAVEFLAYEIDQQRHDNERAMIAQFRNDCNTELTDYQRQQKLYRAERMIDTFEDPIHRVEFHKLILRMRKML